MLYRPRNFSIAAFARRTFIAIGGIFGEFRRTARDTAYVETLNDFHLRDLAPDPRRS